MPRGTHPRHRSGFSNTVLVEGVNKARRKAGYSVTDAARELGVAVSLVSQIESGKRNATPAMLLKMAEVYNCPLVILERKRYPVMATEDKDAA